MRLRCQPGLSAPCFVHNALGNLAPSDSQVLVKPETTGAKMFPTLTNSNAQQKVSVS